MWLGGDSARWAYIRVVELKTRHFFEHGQPQCRCFCCAKSSDLAVLVDGRDIPDDTLASFIVSKFVYTELVVFEATYGLNAEQLQATDFISNSLLTSRSLSDLRSMPENHWYSRVHPVYGW